MASLLCCVVDRIADDILDSCVSDIAKELEHINGEIVDHVYNAEFSVTPWLETCATLAVYFVRISYQCI